MKLCLKRMTLLLLLAAGPPGAAAAPAADPAAAGFSPQRLARIDRLMNAAVADGLMAGGEGLIARGGEVIYHTSWGDRDREAEVPATPETIYRIYSMSKPLTTVALLMLYEEGRFLLEDPVARYLPELAALEVAEELDPEAPAQTRPAARQPTIRDLLRHSAGFSYGVFGDSSVDRAYRAADLFREPTLAAFTRTLGTLPLQYDPGERWHYSVAVDVQGRLVEVLAGMPFGEFLRTRIFEPLAMEDTHFQIPASKRDRLAQLYSPAGTAMAWDEPWQLSESQELEVADPELSEGFLEKRYFTSGGGGLLSTATDYLRFAQLLLNGGALDGVRLLAPLTVRHMHRNHSSRLDTAALYSSDGFGLGVSVLEDAGVTGELAGDGSFGWGGAAGTFFWIDPAQDLVGIFMTQSVPHQTQLARKFRVLTYQALVEPTPGGVPEARRP